MLIYAYFMLKLEVRWRNDRAHFTLRAELKRLHSDLSRLIKEHQNAIYCQNWNFLKNWMICSVHVRTEPKYPYRKFSVEYVYRYTPIT